MGITDKLRLALVTVAYFIYYFVWRGLRLRLKLKGHPNKALNHTKAYLGIDSSAYIYYELFDQAADTRETLVLLHGGLTSITAWFAQIPKLSAHFRLVCIDLRGQGRSTLGDLPFSYRLFAADLCRVMDHLKIQTFHVAGWSDGGNVGLLAAVMCSDRVKSLVTIGSNYHYSGLNSAAKQEIQHADTFPHPIVARCLYSLESSHPGQWHELVVRTLALWRQYPRLTEKDLSVVHVATQIVVGEYDMISLAHAETMAGAMPHAKLKVINGRGHNLLFTEPKLISHLILDFANEHKV